MSGQSAGVTVLNRTIATVLFSTVTGCLGSTGRFQLDHVGLKSDSNFLKPSLVHMYYTHSGYQISISGKNCVYCIQIFMVVEPF